MTKFSFNLISNSTSTLELILRTIFFLLAEKNLSLILSLEDRVVTYTQIKSHIINNYYIFW